MPDLPADSAALLAAADAMSAPARATHERVADASAAWQRLPDVFDTPETGSFVTAMQPALSAAVDIDETGTAASVSLRSLAENLSALEWTRARLLDDIAAHRSMVLTYRDSLNGLADDPDDPLAAWGPYGFARNEELTQRCASLRGLLRVALDDCERELRRIGDVEGALPVMWASPSAEGPLLTWAQRNEVFAASISMAILDRLSRGDADGVSRSLDDHPDWRAMLNAHPPGPTEVSSWWSTLDVARSSALIGGASSIIGNLEGVAYASRDRANRATLAREIEKARAALAAERKRTDPAWGPGYGVGGRRASRLGILQERMDNLLDIEEALEPPPNRAARHLLTLTDDRPPLAAISIGDVGAADNVTFAIPGMGTTTREMSGWAAAAQNLLDEQRRAAPTANGAVVAWIGYRTPPVPLSQGQFQVLGNEYAEAGGENLSETLAGFVSTRQDAPSLSVVGHSYGTTTAAAALAMPSTPSVDSFVALGSAGLPASIDSVSDVKADKVYAGQARNVIPGLEDGQGDQWAWTGRTSVEHPVDPTASAFGARAFGADGDNGMRPVTDHGALVPAGEGWGYFDSGTEALRNAALATTGQGDRTTPALPKSPSTVQQSWKDIMNAPGIGL